MFNIDIWQEIFYTINKNRVRTFITGFCVFFGIFILIILMGFGEGFQNGVRNQFDDDAVNSIFIRSGKTSVAHAGLQLGRNIKFDNDDYTALKNDVEGIDKLTGRYYLRGEFTVRYENKYSFFSIRGVHPDHKYPEKTTITEGRFVNDLDISAKRKIAVVGSGVVKVLFPRTQPMGKQVTINGIKYKIVGVFHDEGSERENKTIYIPIATAQLAYGGGKRVDMFVLTVGEASMEESLMVQDEVETLLAERHRFSKSDKEALRIGNVLEEYARWMGIFDGIRLILSIVGSLALVAGIIGVSNIMLIVVKERTREIGVRKAIGASPISIIALFLQEALFVTIASGYIGMVVGMLFVQTGLLTDMVLSFGFPEDFFIDPNIRFSNAVVATLVLALFGALAGYFPARKAAKIQPIEALRDE